jgi:hypothetical protein
VQADSGAPGTSDDLDDAPDNEGSLAVTAVAGGTPSAWGAPGPDGGPMMGFAPAGEPPPPFEPSHCPCLRGPCRHLHQVFVHFEHGNLGTLERQPRERKLMCRAQHGVFLELSGDAPVLDCSLWDPADAAELAALELRRRRYFAAHPDHDPDARSAAIEAQIKAEGVLKMDYEEEADARQAAAE